MHARNRAKLRKSVSEFGLVTTLIWNKRTGNLVGGHRRLEEIDLAEGTSEYSLTVAEIDIDPLREKALNLVLNNPAAQGEYDDKLLAKLLEELEGKLDIELTGFDESEVERMLAETILPDAQFPITSKLNERYDFVMVFTDNESDFAFLQTVCGVQVERSYKKTGIGIGRAIPFKRFLSSIRENRHSLDVQGGHDDNASANPERRRVRPGKSAR
jgi:hypothetical protein